jgi:hypothetical protein
MSIGQVSHKIRLSYRDSWKAPKVSRVLKEPVLDFSISWGFFDGTCQGTPGMCRAGVILHLDKHHFFLEIWCWPWN